MFKWFADMVADRIRKQPPQKIYDAVREVATNQTAEVLKASLRYPHRLTRSYSSAWGPDELETIRSTITEAFDRILQERVSAVVTEALAEYSRMIHSEEFINGIVERINRKQLGS